jgi:tRNA-splicing ligase RtcB
METLNPLLLSWAVDLESQAREQAERTSRLPILAGPVALMPDAHWGMGATVGSVIPTKGAVIPAAIGVDIGCGMIAAHVGLTSGGLPDNLDGLHAQITRSVPAGVGHSHTTAKEDVFDAVGRPRTGLDQRQIATVQNQLGTLGSGNHFVELCLDQDDEVWVVLHSGSRGIGNQLATRHIAVAKQLADVAGLELEDVDLAWLTEGTPAFDCYIADMLWAQDYAALNRERMMDAVLNQLYRFVGADYPLPIVDRVNCHHNFTIRERHRGHDVWVTRKGAIRAGVGDRGVIPGSMGTSSYIVEGLGNSLSYASCSHGAGRRMSRGAARRTLDVESLTVAMAGKSWNADAAAELIDEDPRSYKDIDAVMAAQSDLATVTHTLHQILNYKGVDGGRKHRRKG